ncbi:MAG: signal peptidase II [Trueperaceae bacterium]
MFLRWVPFALAAAVVALDQLSKAWVVAEVPLGARAGSWGGLLHLTHTRNSGAAFGLLRDFGLALGGVTIDGVQLLGLVSLVVAVALAVWLLRSRSLGWGTRLALGAVMGGAVGNGIDRWRLHYVVDFIHAQAGWFDFPVFNVADVGISVGAAWLLLSTLFASGGHPHGEPRAVMAGEAPGDAERDDAGDARVADAAAGETRPAAVVSDAPSRSDDDR